MPPNKKSRRNDSEPPFANIHVPKMKSVFWKYFGFPADENNEIISKQKLVCILCHTRLTNHNNTTNMRCHVQSTHKDIFAELVAAHGIQVPPRRIQKKTKLRSELINCVMPNRNSRRSIKQDNIEQINYSSHSELNEEDSIPLTYDDTDPIVKDVVSSETGLLNNFFEQTSSQIISPTNESGKDKSQGDFKITVNMNPIRMPIEYGIEDALRKMIVKDLQNVSSIYSCGMQELVTGFLSNQVLPPLCKMESSIRDLHNERFEKVKNQIKVHSQAKLYSLSFDVWTNVECKQFVSIYFNNISEEYENQFSDNLYMTVELNDYTLFDQIFDEFKLENCSAAVINYNHKILNTFLSNNDIPIVHCFSYIVNTCIDDVFKISEVSSILKQVQEVITRYAPEICSENVEVPTICKDFPLTKLTVLKFFCENVSWPDELDELTSRAKHILDVISPLEVTLETLKEEDIPLSSLFLPFADKIIEKHFLPNECDDPTVQEIKNTIISEIKRSVCSNNHLTVTAMLDPRFHKYLSSKNISICANILDKKFKQISKQNGYLEKLDTVRHEMPKTSKKSHLKMFFDCLDSPSTSFKSENSIENDLRRYRQEAFASLELSPLLWWYQWGHMYGSLKQLADGYNSILGFVNMRFKCSLKEQISFHRKRFMLTGKLIDQIVFLNKHF